MMAPASWPVVGPMSSNLRLPGVDSSMQSGGFPQVLLTCVRGPMR